MLFVELDLHSVVEFYLGAACISFDLYDLVVGIVVGDVLGDRCRDDSGRNGAVLAIDVGPLALAVELDLVAVFERDFIAFPKIGFFFGKATFRSPKYFLMNCCAVWGSCETWIGLSLPAEAVVASTNILTNNTTIFFIFFTIKVVLFILAKLRPNYKFRF